MRPISRLTFLVAHAIFAKSCMETRALSNQSALEVEWVSEDLINIYIPNNSS